MQTSPQLRADRVCLAPRIFTTLKGKPSPPSSAEHYLLNGVSFDVFQGDRVAIVGASGSGKTSLLRLLNRLNDPTSGAIYLENQDYRQIPVLQLRQQIVLVLQESKLLGMTVQQALEYPLTLRGLSAKTIRSQVGEWIERLNLPPEWLSRTELQLSVGQRQLVAIVRALATQPKILLLDEPTAALDVGRSQRVLDVLTQMTQCSELTVLMTNHQLELAEQFSTRVLHLETGRLVQNLPAQQMDWQQLKQSLIQAEARQTEEWD